MTYQIRLDYIGEEPSAFDVRFTVTATLKEWSEHKIPSRKERYLLLAKEMRAAADYIEKEAANATSPIGKPIGDQRLYP